MLARLCTVTAKDVLLEEVDDEDKVRKKKNDSIRSKEEAMLIQLFYRDPPNWEWMEKYLEEHPNKHMKKLLRYTLEKQAPFSIVSKILQGYPSAVTDFCPEEDSFTCLHLACVCSESKNVVRAIFDIYPLHAENKSANHSIPLHNARSLEIAQFLLDAYPQGIAVKNIQGFLPLHTACINIDCSAEVVQYLLEEGRECTYLIKGGITTPTNSGLLPLDLLTRKFMEIRNSSNRNHDDLYNGEKDVMKNLWDKIVFIATQHLLAKIDGMKSNRQPRKKLTKNLLGYLRDLKNPRPNAYDTKNDYFLRPENMSILHTLMALECPSPLISYVIHQKPEDLTRNWDGKTPLVFAASVLLPKNPKYAHDIILLMLKAASSYVIVTTTMPKHAMTLNDIVIAEDRKRNGKYGRMRYGKSPLYHVLDNFICEDNHKDNMLDEKIIINDKKMKHKKKDHENTKQTNFWCSKIVEALVLHDRRILEIPESQTMFYPFMYAAACTTVCEQPCQNIPKEPTDINMIYLLLRQSPWVMKQFTSNRH